jgi:hypothetical protein
MKFVKLSASKIRLWITASLVIGVCFAHAQTTPSDAQSKTKFADKIGHWLYAYGMSSPDFLTEDRAAFKEKAFAEVYVEATINYDAWMFNLLNKVTKFRYPAKQMPHIIFEVKFTPTDATLTKYNIAFAIQATSDVSVNLQTIANEAAATLSGKTYTEPALAVEDIEKAIKAALTTLADKLGNELAPNLLVRYANEVFWNGHEIPILEDEGNYAELEAVDKTGAPINSSLLTWTNADPFESKGVVDMTGISSKEVTLVKAGEENSPLHVTLKRVGTSDDINELLKMLIVEVLTQKKQEAQDTIIVLKRDSANNAIALGNQISILEDGNYPLEDAGHVPTPFLESPKVLSALDLEEFNKSNERTGAFALLRKHKNYHNRIRKKVNVVAFANLVVDRPEKIEALLRALLENSGRLVARLILNRDSQGMRDAAKNIVVDFLNQNLETIAGSNFGFKQEAPPLPVIREVTVKPVVLGPANRFYINPKIGFHGKATFVTNMTNYLNSLQEPTYVVINYSQDLSTENYLRRVTKTKPVGLPDGAKYLAITLFNIPGSVMYNAAFDGNDLSNVNEDEAANTAQGQISADLTGIIERATDGGTGDPFTSFIMRKLSTLRAATGLKYFVIMHCDVCQSSGESNAELSFSEPVPVPQGVQFEGLPGIPTAQAVEMQFVQKANGKCLLIFYKYSNDLTADLASASTANALQGEIIKRLIFFDGDRIHDCTARLDSWSTGICSLNTGNIFTTEATATSYYNNLFPALGSCLGLPGSNALLSETQIKALLGDIQGQARSGQQWEFSQAGKVYSLQQNMLTIVQNAMSVENINAGNWTDQNIDIKSRLRFRSDGILEYEALGLRNNLTLATGKTADLKLIASNMRVKNNAFLAKYLVTASTQKVSAARAEFDADEFPDGKKVKLDENAGFFKVFSELGGIGIRFLKTAEIEEPVYIEETETTATIKAPPIATGTIESVAMTVTDLTSTACMVHDLATDAQARANAKEGFGAIKDKIVENPTTLFPILGEVVLEEVTGATPEGYSLMFSSSTNEGKREHLLTKTSVRTATSIFASSSFISKLPEMATKIATKMTKAKIMLRFKDLGDVKNIAENLIKDFEDKVKALQADADKFLDDFKGASDQDAQAFLEKPEMVEAWDKLNDGGVDEALRKKPEVLRKTAELKCP